MSSGVGIVPPFPEGGVERADRPGPARRSCTSCHGGCSPYASAICCAWRSPRWVSSSRREWHRSMPPAKATSRSGAPGCRITTSFWWCDPPKRTRWSSSTSPPAALDRVAKVLVLLLAVGELVQVRAPHQALDDDAAFGRRAQQLADGGAVVAHLLVGVAAPVGEEQVVTPHRAPRPRSPAGRNRSHRESAAGTVACAPGRNRGGRVASLFRGEEPVCEFRHATRNSRRRSCPNSPSVRIAACPGLVASSALPARCCCLPVALPGASSGGVDRSDDRTRQGGCGDGDRSRHDGGDAPEGGHRPGHGRRQGGRHAGRRRLHDQCSGDDEHAFSQRRGRDLLRFDAAADPRRREEGRPRRQAVQMATGRAERRPGHARPARPK